MIINFNNDINCLILSGGMSSRMNFHKSEIKYNYKTQNWIFFYNFFSTNFDTFISTNFNWIVNYKYFRNYKFIIDIFSNPFGPITSLLTAIKFNNKKSWFLFSCDNIISSDKIFFFLNQRRKNYDANILLSKELEPLFCIYEISSFNKIIDFFLNGCNCLKTILSYLNINKIVIDDLFININTIKDLNHYFVSKIRILVLYFSFFKDFTNLNREVFYLTNYSIIELYKLICNKYHINIDINYLKIVANNEFIDLNYQIKENDVLSFLPPVSGG